MAGKKKGKASTGRKRRSLSKKDLDKVAGGGWWPLCDPETRLDCYPKLPHPKPHYSEPSPPLPPPPPCLPTFLTNRNAR